jgi:glycerophosphoryl diester phosphodiesterase
MQAGEDVEQTVVSCRIPYRLLSVPIAHRGLHCGPDAPENSLPAFERAVELGLPIELDVQLLCDGTVAVFHDSTLERMTGKPGLVTDVTAPDLEKLCLLGTTFNIPTLKQTLDLVCGQVPMLIELKTNRAPGPLEQAVCAELAGYAGEFAIQSFNQPTIAWFQQHQPTVCRGQLSGGKHGLPGFEESVPDFIGYQFSALPNADVSAKRTAGTPVLAWTISSSLEAQHASRHADNIIFEGFPAFDPR